MRSGVGNLAVLPTKDEAFMTLLLSINDTRKRVAILCLLSFLAMC